MSITRLGLEPSAKRRLFSFFLQIGICVIIFFVVAVLIFSMRAKEKKAFVMPNLLRKNFLNVYGQLQSLELRVKVSRREYKHLPTGLILSQSAAPGQVMHRYDSLHLIVNQPQPFIEMPNLVQSNLDNARSVLKRIPANGQVYNLKIASIARLYSNDFPHNTIIAQFPLAGELVDLEKGIYFLVALRKKENEENIKENINFPDTDKKEESPKEEDPSSSTGPEQNKKTLSLKERRALIGQNVVIAAQYFHYRKIDYRIRHISPPHLPEQLGLVYKIAKSTSWDKEGPYFLDVYYQEREKEYPSFYEKIMLELDKPGICVVKNIPIGKSRQRGHRQQNIFLTQKHSKDEEVKILFYRQGAVRIEAWCGQEMVYGKNFYPDDIS